MKNLLIRGGPGTGKTVSARAIPYYVGCLGCQAEEVFEKEIGREFPAIEGFVQSEFVEFIQVHPSMTYEDVVYGIEVSAQNGLTAAYAEKRIKSLCDRALQNGEKKYFVILDDIGRTNGSALLGNLLYAMEYRGQPVELVDGQTLTVPENVVLIVTQCGSVSGEPMEYALRRRFDYEKELFPSERILERHYRGHLSPGAGEAVLRAFRDVMDFTAGHLWQEGKEHPQDWLPGHGMLMVDPRGNEGFLVTGIQQKFTYQLYPYLKALAAAGILRAERGELEALYFHVTELLNGGEQKAAAVEVEKIFCRRKTPAPYFTMEDAGRYYQEVIVPGQCREHRTMIEIIADVILLNGILPVQKALSDVFLNTNLVRFESRNTPGVCAAFFAEERQTGVFGYLTTVSRYPRSYYSTNPCRTGRWKDAKDAPGYLVRYPDGETVTYVLLNAFRDAGFEPSGPVIHAEENTASIYCALYDLVKGYLDACERGAAGMAASDPAWEDMHRLILLDRWYWQKKHEELKGQPSVERTRLLGEAVLHLQSLWHRAGETVSVDEKGFLEMAAVLLEREDQVSLVWDPQISSGAYERLFRPGAAQKTIEIKGVDSMVDLKDYQKIMEHMGVRQMIFQGPPGTSKTFESKKFILKQLNPQSPVLARPNPTQEEISRELAPFKLGQSDYENPEGSAKLATGGWDLVQFHPSYGYEDFIRGIEVKAQAGMPVYQTVNRILGKLAEFAALALKRAPGEAAPRFYLMIDEINRANLATVFGELIYGLEYRNSRVSTPYEVYDRAQGGVSRDILLGNNLYLIGTMNTADKSIDSIDYAIRRRFLFIDSPADRNVILSSCRSASGSQGEHFIELLLFDGVGELFENPDFFNEEYQSGDVRVGHTYFLRERQENYREIITERLIFQVIPILREYVKDGILYADADLRQRQHSVSEIADAPERERISLVGENILVFVRHFGERDKEGTVIDNGYLAEFVEELCERLGY